MKLHYEKSIDVAHHLPKYKGKCRNIHGHTMKIEVDIWGNMNPKTNMVIDFRCLENIIDRYDHQDLNKFFDNPTAEVFAFSIHRQIEALFKDGASVKVRVWESDHSWVEEWTK